MELRCQICKVCILYHTDNVLSIDIDYNRYSTTAPVSTTAVGDFYMLIYYFTCIQAQYPKTAQVLVDKTAERQRYHHNHHLYYTKVYQRKQNLKNEKFT
jgi:hypothetical protein